MNEKTYSLILVFFYRKALKSPWQCPFDMRNKKKTPKAKAFLSAHLARLRKRWYLHYLPSCFEKLFDRWMECLENRQNTLVWPFGFMEARPLQEQKLQGVFKVLPHLKIVKDEFYASHSTPFSHSASVFSLFPLSFSFSLQVRFLLPLTNFPHLIRCSLVTSHHSVHQSCEALRRQREQQPFWRGSFLASVDSVGEDHSYHSARFTRILMTTYTFSF